MRAEKPTNEFESRVTWRNLEEAIRQGAQELLQHALEVEVTEFLGRQRSERRAAVDATDGYRNGYGKPRRLTTSCGTIELRRPRVRDVEERFESRLLPLFVRRTEKVDELLPELYLHGLALGDFDLAMRGLLGDNAPISAATIARLKEKWKTEYNSWTGRSLEESKVVYMWVDGVYVKAGLEKDKAALLVAIAGLADGRKEIVALRPGHRESESSWSELLRDLAARGMNAPSAVIGDGHLGIWAALRNVFPTSGQLRCWNHRMVNILDKIPKRLQQRATILLREIPNADSEAKAEHAKQRFQSWCNNEGLAEASAMLDRDWERMVAFYGFPKEHWIHLRTTNIIESPFAALRLRTDAAKRFSKVANATAMIFKALLVAQKKFRRLNAPHLLSEVFNGVNFKDGHRAKPTPRKKASA